MTNMNLLQIIITHSNSNLHKIRVVQLSATLIFFVFRHKKRPMINYHESFKNIFTIIATIAKMMAL